MKTEKKSWVVVVRKEVLVEIITEPCTQSEAWTAPDSHAASETETEVYEFDVLSCEPNE